MEATVTRWICLDLERFGWVGDGEEREGDGRAELGLIKN
jgi:hypothetical protein